MCSSCRNGGANAQDISFEGKASMANECGLWQAHRAVPLVGDFNNDGFMDFYYGGTSGRNGWQARGSMAKGLGNGSFEYIGELETEEVEVEVPVLDDDGNPTGETKIETQTKVLGMKSGLPYTAYGHGSLTLDFNQDGLLDFLFLNRGGNDTGTRKGFVLVKNLGDMNFEVMSNDTICKLECQGDDGSSHNEGNENTSVAVADYDRDGYPDVLIQGRGNKESRYVKLFHNKKGEGFEEVNVFHPLPWDIEPNKEGLYKKTEPTLDEDGQEVPGDFYEEPTMKIKPMSHGAVAFGDFNNDGWPDIVTSGYMDKQESLVAGFAPEGYGIRFYKNLGNGEFQDATDELCADGETVQDVIRKWQAHEVVFSVVDYDQDGKQDILMTGWLAEETKNEEGNYPDALLSRLFRNVNTDGKTFAFVTENTSMINCSGLPDRAYQIGDFNGDGYLDSFTVGWSNYNAMNSWFAGFSLSNSASTEHNIVALGDIGAGYTDEITLGDFDGDYNIDYVGTSYWNQDSVYYFRNTSEVEMTLPEMPSNLEATSDEEGNLTLTWEGVTMDNGNQSMYNVYVKNNETGERFMLVPANMETGYQSGYGSFSNYLVCGEFDTPSYTFFDLPKGSYTVGVQAVTYAYTASAFATSVVDVENGMQAPKQEAGEMKFTVTSRGNHIVVSATESAPVAVYSSNGAMVASGLTNTVIPVGGKGVFMVKVNNQTVKVVK